MLLVFSPSRWAGPLKTVVPKLISLLATSLDYETHEPSRHKPFQNAWLLAYQLSAKLCILVNTRFDLKDLYLLKLTGKRCHN